MKGLRVKHLQIALDGPSGAGKSTMARHVAQTLGILYLDTGAMYRAVGLKAMRQDINPDDAEAVGQMLAHTRIDIVHRDGGQHVFLDGEDVSQAIRANEVSMCASRVSAHQRVREKLVAMQQEIAAHQAVIMDGRDIGTKVLPNATVKIFLTASAEDRARRRFLELQEKGTLNTTYEALLQEIKTRDFNDSNRAHSPLAQAEDAILLDTTGFSLEQSVAAIMRLLAPHLNPDGTPAGAAEREA
jgi:cytidylate kinase